MSGSFFAPLILELTHTVACIETLFLYWTCALFALVTMEVPDGHLTISSVILEVSSNLDFVCVIVWISLMRQESSLDLEFDS